MKEIERRFLLKRMPELSCEYSNLITQFYVKENGEGVRYRGELIDGKRVYTRTIKKDIENSFAREEIEEETTQEEFIKHISNSDKIITKLRGVYDDGDVKWEIDQFKFFSLIIAEVEMPSEDYDLKIPKEISNVMIMEVTGMKEFNNFSLADSYEKAFS